jgi:hypothetical protein
MSTEPRIYVDFIGLKVGTQTHGNRKRASSDRLKTVTKATF